MGNRTSKGLLYQQVKDDIISKIESGEIAIGDKLMSETEMMHYYKVGRVTVRTALSSLEAMGCLRKERGVGTFCLDRPVTVKQLNIDLILNCNDTYLVPYLLAGINSVLETKHVNLLIHNNKNTIEDTENILQAVLARGTDGVIFQQPPMESGGGILPLKVLQLYRRFNIPTICICGKAYGSCVNLAIDDKYGAYNAAQYLIECGHKRILGVFPKLDYGVKNRHDSIVQATAGAPDVSFYALSVTSISKEAERLLAAVREHQISAVIGYNDFYAVQCMHILQENGYRVPEDISIIGFDDSALAMSAVPQLTTIAHPKDHMGADAAKTIQLLINGTMKSFSDTIYRPELIIRQSVRLLRDCSETE